MKRKANRLKATLTRISYAIARRDKLCLEQVLDASSQHDRALIAAASTHARDAQDICHDISATLFPRAINGASEELVSAVRTKILALVAGIEAALQARDGLPTGQLPQSWSLLSRSGFLGEADLVDFMLARVAEDRIERNLLANGTESPPPLFTELLDDNDRQIADTARVLLAADSVHRRARGHSHQGLRPEMLHRLCWRVVAALEVVEGKRDPVITTKARSLLDGYDEANTIEAASRRMVHLTVSSRAQDFLDIERAGLHLFAANMATSLDMDHDHVLRLIDGASAAPLATMLRAMGVSRDAALTLIYMVKGFSLTPQDIHLFESGYAELNREDAASEIRQWSAERTRGLLSVDGGEA